MVGQCILSWSVCSQTAAPHSLVLATIIGLTCKISPQTAECSLKPSVEAISWFERHTATISFSGTVRNVCIDDSNAASANNEELGCHIFKVARKIRGGRRASSFSVPADLYGSSTVGINARFQHYNSLQLLLSLSRSVSENKAADIKSSESPTVQNTPTVIIETVSDESDLGLIQNR